MLCPGKPLVTFGPGDLVASLFSLTATMVGVGIHSHTTVRATKDSVLLRLSPRASRIAGLDESAMQEIVRMCAVRLYHVTIMTLGKFLGLTNELFVDKAGYDSDEEDPNYPKTPTSERSSTPRFEFDSTVLDDDLNDNVCKGDWEATWSAARLAVAEALQTDVRLLPEQPHEDCGLSVHSYDEATDIVTRGWVASLCSS